VTSWQRLQEKQVRIQVCLYFLIATGDTWTPDEKGLMTHAFFLSSP
jgi:hypothetical protein